MSMMYRCSPSTGSMAGEWSVANGEWGACTANPTTGNFTVKLGQQAQAREPAVFDATGRLVLSRSVANATGMVTMDMSGHENGMYLVQVLFMDGTRAVEPAAAPLWRTMRVVKE